jgi:hypothetical protein
MLQTRGSATILTLTANKAMHPQKKLRPGDLPLGPMLVRWVPHQPDDTEDIPEL